MTRTYNVFGPLSGDFGLGVAARFTVQALLSSGRRVRTVDVMSSSAKLDVKKISNDDVNLFCSPPNEATPLLSELTSHNSVCMPFWELPLTPRKWRGHIGSFDRILAPTKFIADSVRREIESFRVIDFPITIPPVSSVPAREKWGIPEGKVVFLVTFDVGSDICRKNPFAAIDAFKGAFSSRDDGVRLVVKVKPWPQVSLFCDQLVSLRSYACKDDRIKVIEGRSTYAEILELYASCDALVSLHRSEGLGLHLMENMWMGKPVVATGWSGNTDFMDAKNSLLVGYSLVPTYSDHPSYVPEVGRDGQVWADPDVGHATELIRSLREEGRRREIGEIARASMEKRHHEFFGGAAFDALEASF